jgi:hypothetical protein
MTVAQSPSVSLEAPVCTALPEKPAGFWGQELEHEDPSVAWLWQGYLAFGQVTLLTSQWKSGKTTLLSVLLARLKSGGAVADLPVAATKAVVVSEEARGQWRPRHRQLDRYWLAEREAQWRADPMWELDQLQKKWKEDDVKILDELGLKRLRSMEPK